MAETVEIVQMNKNISFKKKIHITLHAIKFNWIAYIFLIPAILSLVVIVFFPLLQGFYFSLTDIDQNNAGNIFKEPSYTIIGLDNFKEIFGITDATGETLKKLGKLTKQTFIWTFVNVFFHFMIGLIFALILNKNIKGRAIFRMLLIVPWAVPQFVAAYSWRFIFNADYGILNTILNNFGFEKVLWLSDPNFAMGAAIATNVWLGFPFMMVNILGGLQSIPKEIYEAAEVEGATKFQQFMHITLPMLKPVAFSSTLLGFIWTFNLFSIIYLVTAGGPAGSTEIFATYAYKAAFEQGKLGLACAYGVIILSVLVVFQTWYSRVTKANT